MCAKNRMQVQTIEDRICLKNAGILLANSKVPKLVHPTYLLGRQKSWGNFPKQKYS
jgi:hypothetical protein